MAKKGKSREVIVNDFVNHVLEHGYPNSIYQYCKKTGLSETEFYDVSGSFSGLEKMFWLWQFEMTLKTLHEDETYKAYSAREKFLAFFYTLLENLKEKRSFVMLCKEKHRHFELYKNVFQGLCEPVEEYANGIIAEGMASEEITPRQYVDKLYGKGFWLEFMFILKFWINDDSPGFEETDAAVEKSVNMAFDLMGKGPMDTIIDFGKFMLKTMK